MIARVKSHLINATVAIVSLLIGYILLEVAVFKALLPLMPPSVRPALPELAEVLAQNSKQSYLPSNYIALLGDSYAEGRGDWALASNGDRTKPFHSADVIHAASGRDVVSFGRGGAGSAEAIVLRPARIFPTSHCMLFPRIEVPREIFIYFYEGNDIEDNSYFLQKVVDLHGRTADERVDPANIDRYLTEHYADVSRWRCFLHMADMAAKMAGTLYRHHVTSSDIPYCGKQVQHANRLVVGGQIVDAPALQGPALPFSKKGIEQAMDVLDHSLSWLRRRFVNVPVTIVYIPSPLSIYRIEGAKLVYCTYEIGEADVAQSERNSDLMSEMVRKIAIRQSIDFIDARPALRSAATDRLIHGPFDWDHLNEAGYRALGSLLTPRLEIARSH